MITTKGCLLSVPICLYFILTKNDWIIILNDYKLFSLYIVIYFLGAIVMALSDVFDKLLVRVKETIIPFLDDFVEGKIVGTKQNEEEVTYAWNIKREEEKIDFNMTCSQVHNLIRGLAEVPGAYCYFKNQALKIYKSQVHSLVLNDEKVGSLKIENKNRLLVKCADGYVELLQIKLEGKQKMDVKAFLNGCNKDELLKETLQ